MIYLDNNATTRPSPGVVEAVRRGLEEFWPNPSSVHRAGQAARARVELARQRVADLIGARAREITFTSGGTEAIDLAIRSVLSASAPGKRRLVTSKVEHAAVREIAEEWEKGGGAISWCPIGAWGVIDPSTLAGALTPDTALVSMQWANNETGVIQPIEAIARLCHERGVLIHVDATQWVGKEPIGAPIDGATSDGAPMPDGLAADSSRSAPQGESPTSSLRHFATSPLPLFDLLTFAPHKFHGPKGVGVLWARPGVRMRPRLLGSQELGRRGGTENVPGILGAGAAAEEALAWLARAEERSRLAALRDRFEDLVLARVPDAVVHGRGVARLWNTSNIGFPRLEAEALLLLLSERGVCASAGAACSSGSLEPSPVLLAMGVPPEIAHGSLRFSLSRETTQGEIEEAARVLVECVERLRESSAAVGRP